MPTVYLALGSNLGDRNKNILTAIKLLGEQYLRIQKVSTIIETDPVGGPPQNKFLNAVLKAETEITPEDLLLLVKNLEKTLGRKEGIRNGPRPIDIDILLYDKLSITTPRLTIPHPRMLERDFVMNPLQEIAPHLQLKHQHENR